MSDLVEGFTMRILEKYKDAMADVDYRMISQDLTAGEFEVAAISAVEMAPVTVGEVDQLMEFAQNFDDVDAKAACLVEKKVRHRLHVTQ